MQILHHRNPYSALLGHGPASYCGFILEKLLTTVPFARVVRKRDCSVDFLRIIDAKEDWVRCESGETLIVPPNAGSEMEYSPGWSASAR
jgi:hypothetical protein